MGTAITVTAGVLIIIGVCYLMGRSRSKTGSGGGSGGGGGPSDPHVPGPGDDVRPII